MIAIRKKKPLPSSLRAKISRILERILPKGKAFELRTANSGIRQMQVVRIVTPAWGNLRPPERISKVLAAMNGQLSDAEQERILRFSVLTPKEYCSVVLNSPVTRIPKNGGAKKLATKRKAAARKPRRALAK